MTEVLNRRIFLQALAACTALFPTPGHTDGNGRLPGVDEAPRKKPQKSAAKTNRRRKKRESALSETQRKRRLAQLRKMHVKKTVEKDRLENQVGAIDGHIKGLNGRIEQLNENRIVFDKAIKRNERTVRKHLKELRSPKLKGNSARVRVHKDALVYKINELNRTIRADKKESAKMAKDVKKFRRNIRGLRNDRSRFTGKSEKVGAEIRQIRKEIQSLQ